jgi:fructose-specific component phosphotransferase system IIB-like protein
MYPHADQLVDYMNYYREHHQLDTKIRLNTEVTLIEKEDGMFQLRAKHLGKTKLYVCKYLLMAIGFSKANMPPIKNIDMAETYATATTNLSAYTGKRVAIIGRGNAAFEFANSIMGETHFVHVLGRAGGRIRLAWETHYPGGVRAIHNQVLESYMLKSLDGMNEQDFDHQALYKNTTDGLFYFADWHASLDAPPPPRFDIPSSVTDRHSDNPGRLGYHKVIVCSGWHLDRSIFGPSAIPDLAHHGKFAALNSRYEATTVPNMFFIGALGHSRDFRKAAGGFIHGFRYTIRALHRMLETDEERGEEEEGGEEQEQQQQQQNDERQQGHKHKHKLLINQQESHQPPVQPDHLHTRRQQFTEAAKAMVTEWPGDHWAFDYDVSAIEDPKALRASTHVMGGDARRAKEYAEELVERVLYRYNHASALYQMFGQLADILVCSRDPATTSTTSTTPSTPNAPSTPATPSRGSNANAADVNANSSSSPSAALPAAIPSTVCVYLEEVPVDY